MKEFGIMKNYISIISALVLISACSAIQETADSLAEKSTGDRTRSTLTDREVTAGLKEALSVGVRNAVQSTSATNGFLSNAEIKLPFPPDAEEMRKKALDLGMESQVEKIVTTLNRAAEEAAKEAAPIFLNAVENMSINDGFAVLNGGEGAATRFLRNNTSDELYAAFLPKVESAIKEVKLTEYWNPVALRYNKAVRFTGGDPVEADLNRYVTERAIDGLFVMVEKEENKIRRDPRARVTSTLQKVFGSL